MVAHPLHHPKIKGTSPGNRNCPKKEIKNAFERVEYILYCKHTFPEQTLDVIITRLSSFLYIQVMVRPWNTSLTGKARYSCPPV